MAVRLQLEIISEVEALARTTKKSSDEKKIFSRRGDCVLVPGETMVEILYLLSQGNPSALVRRNRDLVAELKERIEIFEPCSDTIHIRKEDLLPLLHILAQRRLVKKPVQRLERVVMTLNKYEQRFVKLCDYVAAVIAQTYIERGDEATLADDEALSIIRELLCAFDETMILRNASRRKVTKLFRTGIKFAF